MNEWVNAYLPQFLAQDLPIVGLHICWSRQESSFVSPYFQRNSYDIWFLRQYRKISNYVFNLSEEPWIFHLFLWVHLASKDCSWRMTGSGWGQGAWTQARALQLKQQGGQWSVVRLDSRRYGKPMEYFNQRAECGNNTVE